jgi:hypothetical protein
MTQKPVFIAGSTDQKEKVKDVFKQKFDVSFCAYAHHLHERFRPGSAACYAWAG